MIDLDRILPTVSRPARYSGGEWNSVVKDWDTAEVRLVLAYPDVYEIGMSNLGLAILYDIVNKLPFALAERSYAPWPDMASAMRREGIPLFSLESKQPVRDFDLLGFSLGYELTYTNVLNMLALAGIPMMAADRGGEDPFVIGGGSCTLNPEPVADFFDLFILGEAEDALPELLSLYRKWRGKGEALESRHADRKGFLRLAARIPGVYVPAFYAIDYEPNGPVSAVNAVLPEAQSVVKRRVVAKLPPALTKPIVPFLEAVHDRAAVEIQRGCTRGCRFCQAGTIYRPVRERSKDEVLSAVEELLRQTGYDELSLVSLSSSDYSEIEPLVSELVIRYREKGLAISLPSLRIDSFSVKLAELVETRKKTGFTFAPEAGTQRLRDVINKGVTEEDLLRTAEAVFSRGWTSLKLYFMIGLPSETIEDVEGIVDLVQKVKQVGRRYAGHRLQVRVSVATFVPKAHSSFQWVAQESRDSLRPKHELLQKGLRVAGVKLSWHDLEVSELEAVLSRGDRRLAPSIKRAWELGCVFDAWSEHFRHDLWLQALGDTGVDVAFYANRERDLEEVLPWTHLSSGVTTSFLRREYQRAKGGMAVLDCRYGRCGSCGLQNPLGPCLRSVQREESIVVPESVLVDEITGGS